MYIIGKEDLVSLFKRIAWIYNDSGALYDYVSGGIWKIGMQSNNVAIDDMRYDNISKSVIRTFLLLSQHTLDMYISPYFVIKTSEFVIFNGKLGADYIHSSSDCLSGNGNYPVDLESLRSMMAINDIVQEELDANKIRTIPDDVFALLGEIMHDYEGVGYKIEQLFKNQEELFEFYQEYYEQWNGGTMDTSSIRTILKELTFGIEVEYDAEDNMQHYDSFRRAFIEMFPKWIIKTDGSVHNGGEVNSPIFRYISMHKAIEQTKEVLDYLITHGCHTHKTAGIHIHVSVRRSRRNDVVWGVKTIINTLKLFLKHEDMMYRIATSGWSKHRGKNSGFEYCVPVSRNNGIVNMLESRRVNDLDNQVSRYYGCNICSWWQHNTLEFRVFNSSLNIDRISRYASICMAMVAKAIWHSANDTEIELNKQCMIYGVVANETADVKLKTEDKFFNDLELNKVDYQMVLTADWQ